MEIFDLSGLRVLVVDDNRDLLVSLAAVLDSFGAEEVVISESGAGGDELIGRHQFDALILDLQMPDTDSWSLIKSIRSHPDPRIRNLPVIALTAHFSPEEHDRVLAASCCAYFQKPPNRHQFLLCLKSCVASARTGDTASGANSGS